VLSDALPRGVGIVADHRVDQARHARGLRVESALDEAFPIGGEEVAAEREQAGAEPPGAAGALGPLVPHPDRKRALHGRRRQLVAVEPLAELARSLVGQGVALPDVGPEGLILAHAIAGAKAEVQAAVREDVHHDGFFGHLQGGAQRGEQDRRADSHPLGAGRHRRREGERLRQVPVLEEVVFAQPDVVGTEALAGLDELEGPGVELRPGMPPSGRVAKVEVESDAHAFPLAVAGCGHRLSWSVGQRDAPATS
jgi:hypothetical protein